MSGRFIHGRCNLCGCPLLVLPGPAAGRCLRCLATPIHRAVGLVIAGLNLPMNSRVYELSSRGALVRYLRSKFSQVYLSEYYDDTPRGTLRRGVPCQDVQALLMADSTFELVTSTEVFEHVPDDSRGFSEICRVLRPGGQFVFTVPLLEEGATVERARREADGSVTHLTQPEYHSDRLRGTGRVLAFRTYGRDICRRLATAGLSADIRQIREPMYGIASQPVIVAQKQVET